MNYLVLETHPAYAVLLDEEGRFLKAANLRYQVGDTVQDIVRLEEPAGGRGLPARPLAALAALAACLCLVFFGYYQPNFTAYGTLRIQINPHVEMTISRTERVLGLTGLNEDGGRLIAGYSYRGKTREEAAGELVERAIEMGYLSGGDTVSISVASRDAGWQEREEEDARRDLEERYGETIVIRLGGPEDASPPAESAPQEEIVIPAGPQEPAFVPASGDSGYGDSGYGPESGAAGYQPGRGDSAYGDSAYEEPGDSGYGGDDDDDDNDDNDDDGDDGGSGYDD